ncbi:MAG: hypothetical protein QOF72_1964 [Blastocatellia bacterium]|jgi:hypothetical protein|nr:hypothetical protein [Blastocatellia bacterium]
MGVTRDFNRDQLGCIERVRNEYGDVVGEHLSGDVVETKGWD